MTSPSPRTAPATAAGRTAVRLAILALLLLAAPAPAEESARQVLPTGRGPQRLDLDAAVLSASARADLGDLRLLDAAGREVPYLLVAPEPPAGEWLPARPLPVLATRTTSGLEADLGAVRPVERLRLDGLPEPFLKRFRLEGSGDRVRWTVLVADGTLFGLPSEGLRRLEVDFARGDYRWLRLTWDDRASAPVPAPRRLEAFRPAAATSAPPSLRVPLAVEPRPAEPGRSRFALRLPGPRLPVRALVLDVASERVHRQARVSEARLGRSGLVPATLGQALLLRVTRDGVGAEALRVDLATPETQELELAVEDGESGPLALRGIAAELAPLPWLYFEAADEAPLRLTAGVPERTAPRYDLEAVRASLAPPPPGRAPRRSTARLGPVDPAPAAPPARAAAEALAAPGAPVDASTFRHARAVAAAPPGLAFLALDAAVQGRTRDLADLRLAGPDGHQIPYLLEAREAPLVIALPPPGPATPQRPGVTAYVVTLPEPRLPPSRLSLATRSRLFERLVRVFEERPAAEGGPRLLAEEGWHHAEPERPAPPLTLALPAIGGPTLRIEIDDGDNAALPLDPPVLLLPGWRLRFQHPGPALTLLYGADAVEAPRYDLALLAARLRAAPATEVTLGPAGPATTRPGWLRPATLAWAGLAAGVLAMLWLLGRLLKR